MVLSKAKEKKRQDRISQGDEIIGLFLAKASGYADLSISTRSSKDGRQVAACDATLCFAWLQTPETSADLFWRLQLIHLNTRSL